MKQHHDDSFKKKRRIALGLLLFWFWICLFGAYCADLLPSVKESVRRIESEHNAFELPLGDVRISMSPIGREIFARAIICSYDSKYEVDDLLKHYEKEVTRLGWKFDGAFKPKTVQVVEHDYYKDDLHLRIIYNLDKKEYSMTIGNGNTDRK